MTNFDYDAAVEALRRGNRIECHSKLHSARHEEWDEVELNNDNKIVWEDRGSLLCLSNEDYAFRQIVEEPDVKGAINLILDFGQTDGAHHKAWVLDQVLRALTGVKYQQVIGKFCDNGEYDWDEGIAP